MSKNIFISSTFKDLEAFRKTVIEAVRQLGAVDVSMEHFGARDDRPKDECLKLIAQSDVFVGIYAHRYGYIPEGDSISILEAEYEAATSAGEPRLIYIIKEGVPWPPELIDIGPPAEKLLTFKKRLLARHIVKAFMQKDDLSTFVAADLGRYFSEEAIASDGGIEGFCTNCLPIGWLRSQRIAGDIRWWRLTLMVPYSGETTTSSPGSSSGMALVSQKRSKRT